MAALSITADSVVAGAGATVEDGTLGEAGTAGQAVYLKASDSRLWLAQNDGTAAEVDAVGVLLNGGAAGQPTKICKKGPVTLGGTTTAKTTTYMVAAAAGGIAPQADLDSGKRICRLGYAVDTAGAFIVDIKNHGVAV